MAFLILELSTASLLCPHLKAADPTSGMYPYLAQMAALVDRCVGRVGWGARGVSVFLFYPYNATSDDLSYHHLIQRRLAPPFFVDCAQGADVVSI